MPGQFDFQASSSPLLSALVDAPQKRQQMELQLQQAKQQRLNSLLDNLQQGANLARTFQQAQAAQTEQAQRQSMIQGQQNLRSIASEPVSTAPIAQPFMRFGPVPAGPIDSSGQGPQPQPIAPIQPKFSQTGLGASQPQRLNAALIQAFPEQAGAAMTASAYPKPPTTLEALAVRSLSNGQAVNPNVVQTKQELSNKQPKYQSKSVTYNGAPVVADYDPESRNYYRAGTKELLTGEIKPLSQMSPMAEVRRNTLINKMNTDLPTKVNPAMFAPSTVAGKAANVVQNADSFLGQADNIINGKVVPDKQVMTALAIDGARVLTQNGVIAESTINDLIPNTAKGKFADYKSYFTNEPESKKQLAFVKNLAMEVRRQRDQKQAILDRTLGGNLPSLNELRRMSPADWEQGLTANGLDVEAAKAGHFKLRPEILSQFYGTQEIPGVTTAAKTPNASGGTDLGNGFSYTVK